MGLDQYLYKETYIGNDYRDKDKQIEIDVEGVKQERVSTIREKIGQWRKANQIHAWFVENVQNGKDNCQAYYVTEGKLTELLEIVKKVLRASELVDDKMTTYSEFKDGKLIDVEQMGKKIKNPSVAKELLPSTSGFFFGSTEYGEWYINDLELTKKILEDAIEESGDYYYESSW